MKEIGKHFKWYTPYSVKIETKCFFRIYTIIYEETKLIVLYNYEDVKKVAAALNGAYNIGRSDERISNSIKD